MATLNWQCYGCGSDIGIDAEEALGLYLHGVVKQEKCPACDRVNDIHVDMYVNAEAPDNGEIDDQ